VIFCDILLPPGERGSGARSHAGTGDRGRRRGFVRLPGLVHRPGSRCRNRCDLPGDSSEPSAPPERAATGRACPERRASTSRLSTGVRASEQTLDAIRHAAPGSVLGASPARSEKRACLTPARAETRPREENQILGSFGTAALPAAASCHLRACLALCEGERCAPDCCRTVKAERERTARV